MKRICAWLMMLVMLSGGIAAAETSGIDLDGLDLEALYILRMELDARIEALEAGSGIAAYEAGGYLIGRDMPAGDYVLTENEDAIFASVTVRTDDSQDGGLVDYALVNRQAMIHFEVGEWVVLSEVTAYPLDKAPLPDMENGFIGEGAYLVGAQIPAGEYTVFTMDKAPLSSYSVYDDILSKDSELMRFEVIDDDVVIQLAQGDYIELSGCMMSNTH